MLINELTECYNDYCLLYLFILFSIYLSHLIVFNQGVKPLPSLGLLARLGCCLLIMMRGDNCCNCYVNVIVRSDWSVITYQPIRLC